MRALSKEAEQRLIGAIENAAELVNAGSAPNDAIIKSATAANIPAGHINLMVHAYNTGRTTKQREQGEDTLEKAADFQLADINIVTAALYPETVKTSAEIQRQETVSVEYALSPAGMLARRKAQQEKVAAATVALPAPTYQPYPRDEQAAAQREYSQKRAAQLAAEEERRQVTAAEQKAAAALDTLADFFRAPGNMPFQDAVRQVELRFGDHGVSALNKVAEIYPHFKKQAATKNTHWGHNRLYDLVDAALTAVEDYAGKQADYKKKFTAAPKAEPAAPVTGSILPEDFSAGIRLKAAWDPSNNPANPSADLTVPSATRDLLERMGLAAPRPAPAPTASPARRSQTGSNPSANDKNKAPKNNAPSKPGPRGPAGNRGPSGQSKSERKSVLQSMGEIIGEAGGKSTPSGMAVELLGLDADPERMKYRAYENITTPDHSLTLKNIRARATLHDMMLNDEVISGYDPHEVATAFNEIADVAPNVVGSPAVLTAMLRKRLEAGQLADFDVKQLIEMDKLKAERDYKMLQHRDLELGMVGGGKGSKE